MVEEITIWSRIINDKKVHNHIENNWADREKPLSKFKSQNSWNNQKWIREYGILYTDKVLNLNNL